MIKAIRAIIPIQVAEWEPDVRVLGKANSRRQDAGDGVRLSIERDRLPENAWIRVEMGCPHSMAQNHHRAFAESVFLGEKIPAQRRRNPKQWKQIV
jgi:hypothetical protein